MEICHISSLITNVITRYQHIAWAPTNDLCSFKERSHFYVLSRAVDDPSLPQTSVRSMFAHTQERNRITAQNQAVIGPLPAQQITRTTYGSIQVCCFLAVNGLFTTKLKWPSFYSFKTCMTFFLTWNSKGEILSDVLIWSDVKLLLLIWFSNKAIV